MYKKFLTTLFVLILSFGLSAQDLMEVSPTLQQVNPSTSPAAMWDVQFDYDATAITGGAGNAGAVYIPTIGKFWTSKWASATCDQWNPDGTLDMTFTLPFTGTRGMCFDGQYVYHSTSSTTVQIVDPVTRTSVGTIPVAAAPNGFRFMTYNPDGNSGAGSIIGGNWTSPNFNFYEFSMTGTLLRTITNTQSGIYGMAYDNYSPGGPFIWVWTQNLSYGSPQLILQMDYATGIYTGVQHDVMSDVGIGQPTATAGLAGGLFITNQLVPGTVTLGGLLQGSPDELFGYELLQTVTTTFFEDFEGFVAGQQLACQDPLNWTTWSNAPCGNEDALISTNYAYSGANSYLVDAVAPRVVDIVKPLGDLTTGLWYLDFMAYIPTGKYGYFNVMATFAPPTYVWATQAYFNAGGTGTLDAGGTSAATFTFPHDTWFPVSLLIDLDNDQAQLAINGVFVYQWQYTLGTFGTPCPLVIAATDMFGPNATAANNEMYVDNYRFSDTPLPVELTSFTANANNGLVELNWNTATEINNQGFEIERRTESSEFRTIGFVEGNGTTTEPRSYSYVDQTADQGVNFYRLKQIDFDGTSSYSDEVEINVTGPLSFGLEQNYPNPFNPTTNIKYSLPEAGNVKISVYNLVGEEVAVLVNGFSQAGTFEVTFDASNLSTGVYLYKLQSANSIQTRKMMLLK